MLTHEERQAAIKEAIAKLYETFGLRGFPGFTFRASELKSYVGAEDEVVIVVQILRADGSWLDFSSGTLAEIQREVI